MPNQHTTYLHTAPDEDLVAGALWKETIGDEAWPDVADEDRGDCITVARAVLAALDLPAREKAIRADERAQIYAELATLAAEYQAEAVSFDSVTHRAERARAHGQAKALREAMTRVAPEPSVSAAAVAAAILTPDADA